MASEQPTNTRSHGSPFELEILTKSSSATRTTTRRPGMDPKRVVADGYDRIAEPPYP
jgi:hypothetical protein